QPLCEGDRNTQVCLLHWVVNAPSYPARPSAFLQVAGYMIVETEARASRLPIRLSAIAGREQPRLSRDS
ncbi:hypothetical protein BaRGS_00000952, partial [Batillaria attramentaria]